MSRGRAAVIVGAQWGDEGKLRRLAGVSESAAADEREPAAEILSEAKELFG
jgi:hypothetical protein